MHFGTEQDAKLLIVGWWQCQQLRVEAISEVKSGTYLVLQCMSQSNPLFDPSRQLRIELLKLWIIKTPYTQLQSGSSLWPQE